MTIQEILEFLQIVINTFSDTLLLAFSLMLVLTIAYHIRNLLVS